MATVIRPLPHTPEAVADVLGRYRDARAMNVPLAAIVSVRDLYANLVAANVYTEMGASDRTKELAERWAVAGYLALVVSERSAPGHPRWERWRFGA